MTAKVLIVDDHPSVREGLSLRISHHPCLEVCGEAADAADSLKLIEATHPDVVVIDIQLKTSNGLDLIKRIHSRDSSIRMLVCSMYPASLYARRALQAGALGYISKEQTTGRIVEAICRVLEGKIYLCQQEAELLVGQMVGRVEALKASPLESLSDRELEVFRLIGNGLSTSQVAQQLHLSDHTIETYRQRIKRKLNLRSASELTWMATRWAVDPT